MPLFKIRRKAAVIGLIMYFRLSCPNFNIFQSRRLLPRALNLGIRDPSRSVCASEWSFIFLELARMMLSTPLTQPRPRVRATETYP